MGIVFTLKLCHCTCFISHEEIFWQPCHTIWHDSKALTSLSYQVFRTHWLFQMIYPHFEEKLLPHLSNNKSEVQTVFSKAERSGNLVSSHTLMENRCDAGLSFISWQSYFHFHSSHSKERMLLSVILWLLYLKSPAVIRF